MNYLEQQYLLSLANFAACSGLGWCCVCRFAVMSSATTRWDVRLNFALLFAAATASGFAPLLFREWPGYTQVGLAVGTLAVLVSGAREWRVGLPEYARTDAAPLGPP
ncbi:hypothetical protein [Rhizobacter sp. Root1221]|uniref:hypothetical protein n=1 Tax=Rhizobacter sp. Root1221 TaxID=1736433 RepID=UPI0006F3152E|nr:hypothetical protein [Rhizobacter sp. Root1221]KQV85421.1 hypothetical protein ASC87_06945 [Rhizobacter sp. Root1221]